MPHFGQRHSVHLVNHLVILGFQREVHRKLEVRELNSSLSLSLVTCVRDLLGHVAGHTKELSFARVLVELFELGEVYGLRSELCRYELDVSATLSKLTWQVHFDLRFGTHVEEGDRLIVLQWYTGQNCFSPLLPLHEVFLRELSKPFASTGVLHLH